MTNFESCIDVLIVESKKGTKPRPDGTFSEWKEARAVLYSDASFKQVSSVGRLRVPKELTEKIAVGRFTATFSLGVPDYGDNKGDIVAQLVGLTSVPPGKAA